MECLSVVGSLLPTFIDCASKHADYLSSAQENLDKARTGLDYLKAKRDTYKNEIEKKEKENKIPSPTMQNWLKEVDKVEKKIGEIEKKYEQRGCRATKDCPLNCCLIYSVSKEASRLHKEIERLSAVKDDQFFVDETQNPAKERPFGHPVRKIKSLKCHQDEVRGYLDDNKAGIVGIWGLQGVGKTTLLTLINNSMLGAGNLGFDHVIWTQTKRVDTNKNLQNAIISELELSDGKDNYSPDYKIFKYLNGKNFLLLVDDMSEEVNLTTLGIPIPGNLTSRQKHKVVFTTHSRSVCSNMMANRMIKLDLLETDEARCLFRDIVTEETISSDEQISNLENKVLDLCGGLPLALTVIGKALSDKRTHQQWEHVIQSINNQQFGGSLSHMKDSVFETLKLSYDSLKSAKLRRCFLSCCLWPRGYQIPINDLIECWMGLGLIHGFNRIHGAYNEGYSIIGDLEGEGLLAIDLAGGDKSTRLHGILWFLARWIASDCGRNVSAERVYADSSDSSDSSDGFWTVDQWASAERVSQMDSEKVPPERVSQMDSEEVLPEQIPECRDRATLILKKNTNIVQNPSEFFKQMKSLKYLDLSFTKVKNLPIDIGVLVELEYLNLSHTCISLLPNELGLLLKLKYLFLRGIKNLPEESINVILKLTQLQVLDVSPYVEITSDVLKNTKKHQKEHLKAISMAVKKDTLRDILDDKISVPLWNIRISETRDTLLLHELSNKQKDLWKLEFHSCINLRSLEVSSRDKFSRLEELCFRHLASLTEIVWKDVSPPVFFPVLQILVIGGCPQLKNITWVLRLSCLQKLHVENCQGMEEVICDADGNYKRVEKSELPRLKELILKNLPRLRSIYNQPLTSKVLESIVVMGCPKLQMLPLDLETTKNNKFKKIEGERSWLESLERDDVNSKFAQYYRELEANTA